MKISRPAPLLKLLSVSFVFGSLALCLSAQAQAPNPAAPADAPAATAGAAGTVAGGARGGNPPPPPVVTPIPAGATPILTIQANDMTKKSSPILYGFMTEEINFSYEGGLYGELVANRAFKWSADQPNFWLLVQDNGGTGNMALDPSQPLNLALNTSLKLDITSASANQRVGIANEGFWGFPVRPSTKYTGSLYAKASANFKEPLTIALVSNDSTKVFATAQIPALTGDWKKYPYTLNTAADVTPTKDARLLIWATTPGTIWFDQVSLFPPTWNDRPNGLRKDIMQLLVDYKPGFLRFPGGNYLEGRSPATRWDWKKTIGPVEERPGHVDDSWANYWSTDGLGLMEFLLWCEDMKAQPVIGVYAGFSLGGRGGIAVGPDLEPYIQDALDEIEYVSGNVNTKWGAQRAKDGHPAPFPVPMIEIGNEDNLGGGAATYPQRFGQMFDAIRAKYPEVKIVSSTAVNSRPVDVIDYHSYPRSAATFQGDSGHFDSMDRNGPKYFVGEYATRVGTPNNNTATNNMDGALGDAAWLSGFERNSDLVMMASYAPLFVNVNPGGQQWAIDLIGYDALNSYGSPSYYAQKIFSTNHGDAIVPVTGTNTPTLTRARDGLVQQGAPLFYSATRDTKTGTIYLKVVNVGNSPLPVQIDVKGVSSVAPDGQLTTMAASAVSDTNSITDRTKLAPVTTKVSGLSTSFMRTFPPFSVSALQIQAK